MKDFKKSVVYQIYPKSFNDTNGDGLGDLKGITVKLDYLKTLGIDYIWLTPFYISPQRDNGYDVADYCNIDPLFGTMEDFDKLVREANKRGIDVMLDMVFNHTSTEHEWFKNALSGDKKYKNYYIFKEPKNGQLPTNWDSKFGGSAWEYVKEFDEYYLHLFDATQADLNWENEEVRTEVFDVVNFWIKKGVKGFRFDVINLISKPMEYKDDNNGDGRSFYTDGPNIHNYIKQLNKETFGRYKDIITVGEMSSTTIDNCIKYSNPKEEELSMVFNFHHLKVDYKDGDKWSLMDFDFIKLKNLFNHWQVGMEEGNGWNAVFWCNHDQPRIVSRFGDDNKYHKESAKMLATSIHLLRGTPYIYQGEEIGMTNCYYDTINSYRDVESINFYNILKSEGKTKEEIIKILQEKSRDNSRSPMQWDNSNNAGFTIGEPWIEICKNYKSINVENSLKDKDSIFYHYQTLIKLRKEYDIISYGNFKLILEEDKSIFAYLRKYKNEKLLVINNFYGKESLFKLPTELKLGEYKNKILISNYKDSPIDFREINLRPYESIVYHLERK
ncbi:alpha,alpha-phosphotrehalase [Clostridium botulinum]|uniref:Alpha,alpha-phosphotrehalase n=1 Tax=Clostridium botulinum TaxID=1491 RepID=A0ABD7CEU2_CLOBO|nr:alpha,alpha-phosphotrehalase [Clostridium botulinum]KGO13396.1 trehalose-6-phosphate hydrolase [Clostridium botulinum]KIN82329.1 trehalose-6-phosphate hydrolase [Clostridium botulinum]QRI51855.1 alpha,alpha-phosphotrehalase [Clostridium botulinum]